MNSAMTLVLTEILVQLEVSSFLFYLQLLPNLYHVGGASWAGASGLSSSPIQETLESMAGEVTRVVDEQLKVCEFWCLGDEIVMVYLCMIVFLPIAPYILGVCVVGIWAYASRAFACVAEIESCVFLQLLHWSDFLHNEFRWNSVSLVMMYV